MAQILFALEPHRNTLPGGGGARGCERLRRPRVREAVPTPARSSPLQGGPLWFKLAMGVFTASWGSGMSWVPCLEQGACAHTPTLWAPPSGGPGGS